MILDYNIGLNEHFLYLEGPLQTSLYKFMSCLYTFLYHLFIISERFMFRLPDNASTKRRWTP